MKIIHIVKTAAFPLEGGHSIRNHNIFKALNSKLSELLIVSSILTISKENLSRKKIFIKDTVAYKHMLSKRIYRYLRTIYKIPYINRPLQLILVYFNYRLIKKSVNIKNYDIIHGHSNHNNGLSAFLLSKNYKKPFIYDLHALSLDIYKKNSLKYLMAKKIETFLIRKADILITIDEELKEHIIDTFNKPSKVIFPAPNGIDSNLFKRDISLKNSDFIPKNKFIIGIDNSKALENFDFIFNNHSELVKSYPDIFFVVFGNEDKSLKLDLNYFKLLPKIKYDEMPKYYSLLNLFIIPRFRNKMSETITPLKILELMSCEIPVLVSDVKGLTECIKDGETGFVFKLEDDIDGLKEVLSQILKFKNIENIGKQARKWVMLNKNWELTALNYLKAYKSLIN